MLKLEPTTRFYICNPFKINPKLHPRAILFHPLSEDVAILPGTTRFYSPKLGLQLSCFVYEIFPHWIAPLQQNKAVHQ